MSILRQRCITRQQAKERLRLVPTASEMLGSRLLIETSPGSSTTLLVEVPSPPA